MDFFGLDNLSLKVSNYEFNPYFFLSCYYMR